MKKTRKIMAVLVALALTVACTGCQKGKETATIDKGNGEIPETLTIFAPMGSYTRKAGAKDNNDTLHYQEMEKLTGCHVEWIHPAEGAMNERFNLTIASGNLPDMMVNTWNSIQGGAKMYAEDGIIIPLRELIKENMPNLTAFLEKNSDIAKQFTDDEGEIYYIPLIRQDAKLKICAGPQMRTDWLKKLGLEAPKNPDELYEVLKAFKTQDPNGNGQADEIPMSGVRFEDSTHSIDKLLWMFGTTNTFYIDEGKVKFGVMEDAYEEGLSYITKLYKEGLIDQDYLLNDRDKMDSKVMNDKVGYIYSLQPTKFHTNMAESGREVLGVPYPAKEGVKISSFDKTALQDVTNISIAVTTANKNPSGSLKWLDNFFGGKGQEIMNFGKEGVSFEYTEDGYPKLTDYIFNNPDGKSQQEACGLSLGTYTTDFPALQEWRYYEQILSDWGKKSIETWESSVKTEGTMPLLSFTEEENEKITQIMSQVSTYVSEKVNKIVIGKSDISELSAIRNKVKQMGIEEAIDIYSKALERYNNR